MSQLKVDKRRLDITLNTIEELVKCGHMQDQTTEAISDKGKQKRLLATTRLFESNRASCYENHPANVY